MYSEKREARSEPAVSARYRRMPSQSPVQVSNTMWAQYSELAARGFYCIGAWLMKNGIKRVVVCCKPVQLYGMGFQFSALDKLVISELAASSSVEIVGLLTQTLTTLGNIPIATPASVKGDSSIDAVLVPEPEMYESALHHFGNRVIFLDQILRDIHLCQIKMMPLLQVLNDLQKIGHKTLYVCAPCAEDIDRPSAWEEFIVNKQIIAGGFGEDRFSNALQLSGLNEKFTSLSAYYSSLAANATRAQGFVVKKNYYIERLTVNGERADSRYVTGCPQEYEQAVYMFGNSAVAGIGLKECDSSPSVLQDLLNRADISAKVFNLGVDGQDVCQLAYRIADTQIESGGTVVVVMCHLVEQQTFLEPIFQENHIPFCASTEYFQRPHNLGEVFLNAHHLNHNGNRRMAELIYHSLFASECDVDELKTAAYYQSLRTHPIILDEYYDPIAQSRQFREYIKKLSLERKCGLSQVGAVIMNCNPFTLGHQYLIESCAAQVDWLYVFVVEEDRSAFPFSDRLRLVEQGVKHLSNVSVLPSGSFMISTLTFPEYFRKDDLKELAVDPSTDVELFGKYIAPALGITVRFAGEEPLDAVTAQYNAAMARILPKLGVVFREIKRREFDGEVISASRVRKLLKQGDFLAIEKLVPNVTMEYLLERYLPRFFEQADQLDYDKMMLGLLDIAVSGKYTLSDAFKVLTRDKPLLQSINSLEFICRYRELYWMLWCEDNMVLDAMTGILLEKEELHSEEIFLSIYLSLAALENEIPAFLYGNIRLAGFYLREQRYEECRSILDDLTEMGAGEHEDVLLLREKIERLS